MNLKNFKYKLKVFIKRKLNIKKFKEIRLKKIEI